MLNKEIPTRIGECQLHFSFFKDPQLHFALLLAPLSLLLLPWIMPAWSSGIHVSAYSFLIMTVWQPVIEEILFRGIIQGQLKLRQSFRTPFAMISLANLLTSLLFALAHLANHSAIWAFAVFFPSLIFGYFRDRHHTILPCIVLHSAYNMCYLGMGAIHNTAH